MEQIKNKNVSNFSSFSHFSNSSHQSLDKAIDSSLSSSTLNVTSSLQLNGGQSQFHNILSLPSSSVHPDLQKERRNASFEINKLTAFIYQNKLHKIIKLRKLLEHNPSFDTRDLWWMSGSERYMRACEQAEEFVRIVKEHKLMEDEDYIGAIQIMAGEDFFLMLHITMFIPAIENLASEEQKRIWLPLAKNFRILGTYSQTELSHGSNVAALQTTADFDEETDEWILNTPNLLSTKWWPGGLAKSCTHSILMARLRIKGKDYGVHSFILQIRDMNTHECLNGIVLLHIGQKLGYNGMDNGTMQLHNVRIPRNNLFMRFISVDRNGVYKKENNQKLLFGTMTFTRKQIISAAGVHLAKSVVIACRYSAIRRQFPEMDKELPENLDEISKLKESQVLNYSTQLYTLLPLLATAVAYVLTGRFVDQMYSIFMEEARKNIFDRVSEIHLVTCALKAMMTMNVSNGIEMARKACGGHGFMLAAGIPLHLSSYIPQATYEGDFVVLSIQAGRALLKAVERKMKKKEKENKNFVTLEFIYNFNPFEEFYTTSPEETDFLNSEWQLNAYKRRACVLTYKAAQTYAKGISSGMNTLTALDNVKIEFTRITLAYGNLIVLQEFQAEVEKVKHEKSLYKVLKQLCDLYALYWMNESYGEFVISQYLTDQHYDYLIEEIKKLLRQLRPNCISICDSFGLPDYLLNSALGRYDGRVYETLFKSTKYEPLNRYDVTHAYYRHIQYILHPERKIPNAAKY